MGLRINALGVLIRSPVSAGSEHAKVRCGVSIVPRLGTCSLARLPVPLNRLVASSVSLMDSRESRAAQHIHHGEHRFFMPPLRQRAAPPAPGLPRHPQEWARGE